MDRIEGESSESQGAPVNDTSTRFGKLLFSFDSFLPWSIHGFVKHLVWGPAAQGMMGSQVIVEPEVGTPTPTCKRRLSDTPSPT